MHVQGMQSTRTRVSYFCETAVSASKCFYMYNEAYSHTYIAQLHRVTVKSTENVHFFDKLFYCFSSCFHCLECLIATDYHSLTSLDVL